MKKGYVSLIIHSSAGHFWGRRAGHGIPVLKTRPKNYFDLPLRCLARRQRIRNSVHVVLSSIFLIYIVLGSICSIVEVTSPIQCDSLLTIAQSASATTLARGSAPSRSSRPRGHRRRRSSPSGIGHLRRRRSGRPATPPPTATGLHRPRRPSRHCCFFSSS